MHFISDPGILRHHYNSESSEGLLSDGERVLGEVHTAMPEILHKEPNVPKKKSGVRKAGKVKRSKRGSESGSGDELSNISDESLPSEMEDVEVDEEEEEEEDEEEDDEDEEEMMMLEEEHGEVRTNFNFKVTFLC